MSRIRVVLACALCVTAAATAAWALAYPQNSLPTSLFRALADGAAVVTLGLVVVPALDDSRHRGELAERAAGPLVLASACWVVAELLRVSIEAAQAAGTSLALVGVRTTYEFAAETAAGRTGAMCVASAAVVCGVAAVVRAPRWSPQAMIVAAGAAAIGVSARSVVGHLGESPLGGIAVAVHALAGAVWCGVLAALVLVVGHRGQWARVLPRFSRLSLVCVVVLLACGMVGAAVVLDAPAALYATGYGRVLTAKMVVTAVLIAVAWRNRAGWLPAVRSHRATAGVSRLRSRVELAIMAVALTLAAALAVTG